MTAEIAIMNKSAVALAADSAVTIDGDGLAANKVFNTANKLFPLSRHHPIGAMIYNTTSLSGVPWETILKMFRQHLGQQSFPSLDDYMEHLHRFLLSSTHVIPPIEIFGSCFRFVYYEFRRQKKLAGTGKNFKKTLEKAISDFEKLEDCPQMDSSTRADLSKTLQKTVFEPAATRALPVSYINQNKRRLTRLACLALTKQHLTEHHSGLILSGFGDNDVFPELRHYSFEGVIPGYVKYHLIEQQAISYQNKAFVLPFASETMVQTVLQGVNPQYQSEVDSKAINTVIDVIFSAIENIAELSAAKKLSYQRAAMGPASDAIKAFLNELSATRTTQHKEPIERAISVMPMGELANIAEILVNLTQIKQRMSFDTETVGGPIDVAVISKNDGFVWIKRKNYFDLDLNPSFVQRHMAT